MSEKFKATVPPSTALKVLKLRRQGMSVTEVTQATGLPPARVEELSEKLGWPDEARVDREIRELEELVVLDSGLQTQGAPKPGPARPRPVDEPERTAPAATPSSSPSSAPVEAKKRRQALKSPSTSAKPKDTGSTAASSGRVSPCTAAGVLPADVRAWASMAGVEISPRGAISESVVNRYLAAMGGAA